MLFIDAYERSIATVQSEMLQEMRNLKKKLYAWEEKFALDKLKEPDTEDIMNSCMKDTFEKLKLCKKYMRHWKIKFLFKNLRVFIFYSFECN